MKTKVIRAFAVLSSLIVLKASAFAQGSLTPPAAPAPTMKTLDQVEARIPIDVTHTPGDANSLFKITAPGSYYLTGNIAGVAGKNGIQILGVQGNVTVDLNGYALIGGPSSLDGISANTTLVKNLAIRNGTVSDWGGSGIVAAAAIGGCYEDLRVSQNTTFGLIITDGAIQRCIVNGNGSSGIQAARATVRDCTASTNGGHGFTIGPDSTVAGCVADSNTANGFNTNDTCTLTNCVAKLNGGTAGIFLGNNCTATGCASNSNTSSASGIFGGTGCVLEHCAVTNNPAWGINVSDSANVQSCVARGNFNGIVTGNDSLVKDCTVQGNTINGIQAVDRCQIIMCNSNGNGNGTNGSGIVAGLRAIVKNCNASENQKSGIVVLGASVVSENNVGHNGLGGAAAGIDCTGGSGSRIEANIARNTSGTGILGGATDIIIRNYSFSNTTNYTPSSGNNFGPIQLPSSVVTPTANF